MFNLGFSEMLFLAAIALVVIGPKQLPEVARTIARLLNELKRATSDISSPFVDMSNEARDMAQKAREAVWNSENLLADPSDLDERGNPKVEDQKSEKISESTGEDKPKRDGGDEPT